MVCASVQLDREARIELGIFVEALLIFGTLCTFHFDLFIIEGSNRILTDVSGNHHFLPTGSAFVGEGELVHDLLPHLPLIGAGLALICYIHNSPCLAVWTDYDTL